MLKMDIDLESSDGYETDCEAKEKVNGKQPPKKAKKVYKQKYNHQWEKDSELK